MATSNHYTTKNIFIMPISYKYKSGESFSYKWWNIKIEEYVLGSIRIYFSIDANQICYACLEAAKKSGSVNEGRLNSIFEKAISESTALNFKTIDTITVFHVGFSMWEKCRKDAQSHIDNVLGDGLSYVKRNNSLQSLSMFF